MLTYLDFEDRIAELEGRIAELRAVSGGDDKVDLQAQIAEIEKRADKALRELYADLDPWQKAQVARHPARPHCRDYVAGLITDFTALSGDRSFADDRAIIAGIGRFAGRPVMVLGQEKGADTASRLHFNFGMARPEGYRKAVRLMTLAERFSLPVITFVDTPGAYPGIGAEERGQAEAIARATERCLTLSVPMVSLIIGEGGSGGAVAIATANSVLMLEHAIYSVISPEGAASILWRDPGRAEDAARAMRITASDLLKLKVIDAIVKEPVGGAHRHPDETIAAAGAAISQALTPLVHLTGEELRRHRREKFLAIGANLNSG